MHIFVQQRVIMTKGCIKYQICNSLLAPLAQYNCSIYIAVSFELST